MSRVRVEFRLTMPSRASWDGRWSGEGRNYVVRRTMSRRDADVLIQDEGGAWMYRWDDGWAAHIRARVMSVGERAAKSDGFLGYDWMVDNIVRYGSPYKTGEVPA